MRPHVPKAGHSAIGEKQGTSVDVSIIRFT